MADYVKFFGTDPTMLGLATIGGLLSLSFAIFQALRFAYRRRVHFTSGVYARRRRKLLRDIGDFKFAVLMRQNGRTDLIIASTEFKSASRAFASIVESMIFASLNAFFYFSNREDNIINYYAGVLMIFVALVDAFVLRKNLRRAWDKLTWSAYPSVYREDLIERAKKLRGNRVNG